MPEHYHRCAGEHTTLVSVRWDEKVIPCPVCGEPAERVYVGKANIIRDEIPGGVTVENYGPQPVTFHSHSERRRYMQIHGLRETERFSPLPGTDKDPTGIPNPKGYTDPQTLANVTALLTRSSVADEDAVDVGKVLRDMRVQVLEELEAEEQEAVKQAVGLEEAHE